MAPPLQRRRTPSVRHGLGDRSSVSRVASAMRYWGLRDSRGGDCSYGASIARFLPRRVNSNVVGYFVVTSSQHTHRLVVLSLPRLATFGGARRLAGHRTGGRLAAGPGRPRPDTFDHRALNADAHNNIRGPRRRIRTAVQLRKRRPELWWVPDRLLIRSARCEPSHTRGPRSGAKSAPAHPLGFG